MPKYKTRKRAKAQKRRRRMVATIPRDKRILMRWALEGTDKDYKRLNELARRRMLDAPEWVDQETLNEISRVGRAGMLAMFHRGSGPKRPDDEQPSYWGGPILHKGTDALSWLFSQMQGGKHDLIPWFGSLPQYALKPFRGENITEVDEQYARILDAGYKDPEMREAEVLGWTRVPALDSEYLSVWDNPDGHRFIAVRGTKWSHYQDVRRDFDIVQGGRTDNAIGDDLQKIIDATEPSRIVDVAAHSLGTVLLLEAFHANKDLQSRIHMTRLFNPAYNPQLPLSGAIPSIAKNYESDPRVRYFINLGDVVSAGGFGRVGPKNVVYRTPLGNAMKWSQTGGVDPYHLHVLRQWMGPYGEGAEEPEIEFEKRDPIDTGLPQERMDQMQGGTPFDTEALRAELERQAGQTQAYPDPTGVHGVVDEPYTNVGVANLPDNETEVMDFGGDSVLAELRKQFGDAF